MRVVVKLVQDKRSGKWLALGTLLRSGMAASGVAWTKQAAIREMRTDWHVQVRYAATMRKVCGVG